MSCKTGMVSFALVAYVLACLPALADTHWSGTLQLAGEGNIYKDTARIDDLEFTVDEKGQLAGKGTATVTPLPRAFVESDNCTFEHTVTPNTFDVAVEGRREGNEILLSVRSLTKATVRVSLTGGPGRYCKPRNSPAVSGDPFAGLSIAVSMVKFHVRDSSPSVNTGHETVPGGFVMDWELHVRCHDCCSSPRPGEIGFTFLSGAKIEAHKEPNARSPVSWTPPHGIRVMFTDVQERDGARWYHVSAGPLAGWVPSSQVSCDRPPRPLPPGKKLYIEDMYDRNVHVIAPMASAANG